MARKNLKLISDILRIGHITNKDKISCKPKIFVNAVLNIDTNHIDNIVYTVTAFSRPDTHGYIYEEFKSYSEAESVFEQIIIDYDVPENSLKPVSKVFKEKSR